METTGTKRALRVVCPDETPTTATDEPSVEDHCIDYWAQVQSLRDDLTRLRPAN